MKVVCGSNVMIEWWKVGQKNELPESTESFGEGRGRDGERARVSIPSVKQIKVR